MSTKVGEVQLSANALTGNFGHLNSNLSTYTRFAYGLLYDAQHVYIVFTPNEADTQASFRALAPKLHAGFASQSTATNFANMNTYDCHLFDVKGICVSVGGASNLC